MNKVYNLDADHADRIFSRPLTSDEKWAMIRIEEPANPRCDGLQHEAMVDLFGDRVPLLTVSFYDTEVADMATPKPLMGKSSIKGVCAFIQSNLDRSFIVICPNGKGRSGALTIFIHELKTVRRHDYDTTNEEFMTNNQGIEPNRYILNELRSLASIPAILRYGLTEGIVRRKQGKGPRAKKSSTESATIPSATKRSTRYERYLSAA